VTFKLFDVVVVPFPFTDVDQTKRRPAVVVSSAKMFNTPSKHTVLAMITSSQHESWPLDVAIVDLEACGLSSESIIRMKLFTIDNRFILKKIGQLSAKDQKSFIAAEKKLLNQSKAS